MTSAVDADGKSLGYINRKFIEEGKTGHSSTTTAVKIVSGSGPRAASSRSTFPAGKPLTFDQLADAARLSRRRVEGQGRRQDQRRPTRSR